MRSKGRVVQNEQGGTQTLTDHRRDLEAEGYHGAPGKMVRKVNISKCRG